MRTSFLLCAAVASIGWLQASEPRPDAPLIERLPGPARHAPDPGPGTVLGAEDSRQTGTVFDWVDVMAVGSSKNYRLYFDRLDNANYHFVERAEERVVLGHCEAGVEQILDEALLPQGLPAELRVARHGTRIGVFSGPRLLVWAFDERRLGGSVGFRNTGPGGLTVTAERRDDIRFSDDFMREEKDNSSATWRKHGPNGGDFAIRSLRNPLLSANAFCYMGVGQGAMSITGETWWDNYRYDVSLRGPKEGKIGLIFAYHDERNYGLFRWTARPVAPDGATTGPGWRELVQVRNGQEEVLIKSAYGYIPQQWYRAQVLVSPARVRIEVDGHFFFEHFDPQFAAGGVGLWCDVLPPTSLATPSKSAELKTNSLWVLMNQHAAFDDIRVTTMDGFEDDFRLPGPLRQGWLAGLGEWVVHTPKSGAAGELHARALPGQRKCLIGDKRWGQYRLACDIDPGSGSGGLVFLYLDETKHYLARTDGRRLELVKMDEGGERVLQTATLKTPREKWPEGFLRMGILVKEGYLRVTADDGTVVEALDTEGVLRGRAGVCAVPGTRDAQPIRFRRLRLMFLEEPEPLVTTNAIFEDEETMSDWTNASKEWQPQQAAITVDGQSVVPLWHCNQFPGDVELIVEPRQINEERHELALSVSKDGKGSHNGYIFLYQAGRKGEDGKPSTILKIVRASEPVAERVLTGGAIRDLSSLSVRRVGPYLVGKINGRPELVYHDDTPLEGAKIAYYAKGVEVRAESSRIVSDHFLNELFSNAPVLWRTAGYSIAEVSNRWQCDPRWSFFSLKNDLQFKNQGGTAALWSKNLYPGDVMLEFYVSNKMEAERGQPFYSSSRDINITLCGDGQDLTKGYTLMWGGHGNKATYLYRNGVEVKRVEGRIPNEQRLIHRAWMSVRVEKRRNRISFSADRLPGQSPIRLVYEDPEPLSGNRVALWTHHHAIMLSRFRISGEGGTTQESPDQDFLAPKTIYEP